MLSTPPRSPTASLRFSKSLRKVCRQGFGHSHGFSVATLIKSHSLDPDHFGLQGHPKCSFESLSLALAQTKRTLSDSFWYSRREEFGHELLTIIIRYALILVSTLDHDSLAYGIVPSFEIPTQAKQFACSPSANKNGTLKKVLIFVLAEGEGFEPSKSFHP